MENADGEGEVGDLEAGFFCEDQIRVLGSFGLVWEVPAKFKTKSASIVAETRDDAHEAPRAALDGGAEGAVVELAVVLLEAAEGVGGVADVVEARVKGVEGGEEVDAVDAEVDGGGHI